MGRDLARARRPIYDDSGRGGCSGRGPTLSPTSRNELIQRRTQGAWSVLDGGRDLGAGVVRLGTGTSRALERLPSGMDAFDRIEGDARHRGMERGLRELRGARDQVPARLAALTGTPEPGVVAFPAILGAQSTSCVLVAVEASVDEVTDDMPKVVDAQGYPAKDLRRVLDTLARNTAFPLAARSVRVSVPLLAERPIADAALDLAVAAALGGRGEGRARGLRAHRALGARGARCEGRCEGAGARGGGEGDGGRADGGARGQGDRAREGVARRDRVGGVRRVR
jgi:hypothetical protein